MGDGGWGMRDGGWGMANGEWGMGNGEWGMGDGGWGMGCGVWKGVSFTWIKVNVPTNTHYPSCDLTVLQISKTAYKRYHNDIPCTRRWIFRVELIDSEGYQAVQDTVEPLSLYLTRFSVSTLLTLPLPNCVRWMMDRGGSGIRSPFLYHSMCAPGWPETRHVKLMELVRLSSTVSLGGLTSGTLPTRK